MAGSVVGILVVVVGTLLLIVRRSDLKSIDNATLALNELVSVVGKFREDLAGIREWIAKEYATKGDLRDVRDEIRDLSHKIERHIEHGIQRREMERRLVIDAEEGG